MLENINNRLMTLIAASAQAEENAEQEAFALARAVVEKLVPSLTEENAAGIVKNLSARISTILKTKQNCLSIFIPILYHMRRKR